MKSGNLKHHQIAILSAALASVAFAAIPGIQWVLLPLRYLNTHVHELCHALASLGTGGSVDHIQVFANTSGVTLSRGGSLAVLASAGYVGAAIFGAMVVLGSRTEIGARNAMRLLALLMGVGMLLWVRGDGVGFATGLFWIGALLAIGHWAQGPTLLFLAQLVGVQQCLNSVDSLYVLWHISAVSNSHSDARIMEQATAIPAVVWATLWSAFSLAVLIGALRKAWSTNPQLRKGRPPMLG